MYLIYHDGFVLGGHTVYLPKLLNGFKPTEYFLVYNGSESVKQYIENLVPKQSRKELKFYGFEFVEYYVSHLIWVPKFIRKAIIAFAWCLRPIFSLYLSIVIVSCLKSIKLYRFKKIVINSGGYFGTSISRCFLRRTLLPSTYIVHNYIPELSLKNKKLLKTISRYVNHWIVGSKGIQKQLIQTCEVQKNNISLIFNN